jgi:hypothetical protein
LTELNAVEYLDQIKKIDFKIRNNNRDHERWVNIADGMGGFSVSERVQTSKDLHKGQNAIAEYIDIERENTELKQKRAEIIGTIERLPSTEYEIIYLLFVGEYDERRDFYVRYTMKEVAYRFDRSYEWVKKRKRKALKMIQAFIDEQTA